MRRRPIGTVAWRAWLCANVLLAVFAIQTATGMYRPSGEWTPAMQYGTIGLLVASVALFAMHRPESGAERAERELETADRLGQMAMDAESGRAEQERREADARADRALRDQRLRESGYAPSDYMGPKCPRCGSIEFTVLGDDGKPLSAGKAMVGSAIAGSTGMFVGAAMGRRAKRYDALCNKCGRRFTFK